MSTFSLKSKNKLKKVLKKLVKIKKCVIIEKK